MAKSLFPSIAAAGLVLAACSTLPPTQSTVIRSSPASPTPELAATHAVTTAATKSPMPVGVPTGMPTPYPEPNLSKRPLIFFGPLPPNLGPGGSVDFMDLFAESAPWPKAARQVQIFMLNGGWVADFPWHHYGTDEELARIITDLNRRGIAVGFEASPLVATDQCGRGIEGFFGPEEGLRIVQRLKRLGANVRYVALDEPFAFGHVYDGPKACHWPAEKIGQQVDIYIKVIKSAYPEAIIGDNEPLWAGVQVEELVGWLDAYEKVSGSKFPFLHLDMDYTRADWPSAARQFEAAARARGIEFGIFYLGDERDSTDAEWLGKAAERARTFEAVAGGRPDHVIFQSWNDRPDRVLPETNPDTFTALVKSYFRTRTTLKIQPGPRAADGSRQMMGSLVDSAGAPLAGAIVELSLRAMDGPGIVSTYTLTGTVPAGATRSDVGFRINTECGCQGTGDLYLYEVRYTEGGETANRVPDGNFAKGLNGWGSWGAGSIKLEPSDRGGGSMLHVRTTPAQDAAINSSPFPVTPGASYTLTFLARVSPASAGSGYLDITFQAGTKEFAREKIQLAAGSTLVARPTTDLQGGFAMSLKSGPAGRLLLEASYSGSEGFWPAYTSVLLSAQ